MAWIMQRLEKEKEGILEELWRQEQYEQLKSEDKKKEQKE